MVEITTENATAVIEDLRARNKALERKIANLEHILLQRIEKTENKFQQNKSKFDNLERMVLQIFRDNPGVGFTYIKLQEECRTRYPNVPWANLERRVRQLRQDGWLWSDKDVNGKVRYWLKLEGCGKKSQIGIAVFCT